MSVFNITINLQHKNVGISVIFIRAEDFKWENIPKANFAREG